MTKFEYFVFFCSIRYPYLGNILRSCVTEIYYVELINFELCSSYNDLFYYKKKKTFKISQNISQNK